MPEGAIPKDGPSAGITMATAMLSTFTGRSIRGQVAMTGEITLRGNVLPVGGIKEKVLAARRSGVRTLVLPEANRNSLDAIDRALLRDLKIELVRDIRQVFDIVLADDPVRPAEVVSPVPADDPAREPVLQT